VLDTLIELALRITIQSYDRLENEESSLSCLAGDSCSPVPLKTPLNRTMPRWSCHSRFRNFLDYERTVCFESSFKTAKG
jgi:hypothetical protein